ncbi:MAG: hypothetical protein HKN35_12780 [Woeseia sp.]|nr:lipoprotein [Woeseia sp.]MBT8095787.1 lipoprotein [Woeseia sp.]NNE61763.1 hypothetical protein [Woeseia sp.]NNL54176.1 hypothetical protein [Woeseia sp.]
MPGIRLIPVFFAAVFLLGACGQTGELYLPGSTSNSRTEIQPINTSSDSEAESEEESANEEEL